MGSIRKFSPHQKWSAAEEHLLATLYAHGDKRELLGALPGRSFRVIQCKVNGMGLQRVRAEKCSAAELLKRKRESMQRLRDRDPAAARAKRNAFHARNRDRQTAKMRDYYAKRFFWGKAMKLRGPDRATTQDLARLWKRQRGRCALTGRRLDRTAQIDHKVAVARKGSDRIDNLQWLCADANLAKRALTDAEFVALCSDVMRWIGERIQLVEDLTKDLDK